MSYLVKSFGEGVTKAVIDQTLITGISIIRYFFGSHNKAEYEKMRKDTCIDRSDFNYKGVSIFLCELNEGENSFDLAFNTGKFIEEKHGSIVLEISSILKSAIEMYKEKSKGEIDSIKGIIATNSLSSNVIEFSHEILKVQLVDYSIAAIIGYYYILRNNCSPLENIPDGIYTVILPLKDKMEMRMVKVEDKCIYVIEKYTTTKYSHFNRMKYLKSQLGIVNMSNERFYTKYLKLNININEDTQFDLADATISTEQLEELMLDYYNEVLNIHKKWTDIHNIGDKKTKMIYLNYKFIDIPKNYFTKNCNNIIFRAFKNCRRICVGAAALANKNILKDYAISKL